jgi:very-short-patch-repair endonuclease
MKPRIPLPYPLTITPFTTRQGSEIGLSERRMRGRDLSAPYPGIRTIRAPESVIEHARALHLRLPSDAFFSSITAALIHGAPLSFEHERSTSLHVARPIPAQALSVKGMIGHRIALMGDDVRHIRGLPISSPARTFCEVAELLSVPDLVAVGDYLIHWETPMTTIAELTDAVARYPGRRGRPHLHAALPMLNDRAESRRESLFRVFLIEAGFSGFAANYPVTLFTKYHRIDIAFPAIKVALEYEGEYHNDPREWRKTMTRRSRLEAAGWHVMQINFDDLADPRELAMRIRAFCALWS